MNQLTILTSEMCDDIPFGLTLVQYLVYALEQVMGTYLRFRTDITSLSPDFYVVTFGEYSFTIYDTSRSMRHIAMIAFVIFTEFLSFSSRYYQFNVTFCSGEHQDQILICVIGERISPWLVTLEKVQTFELMFSIDSLALKRKYNNEVQGAEEIVPGFIEALGSSPYAGMTAFDDYGRTLPSEPLIPRFFGKNNFETFKNVISGVISKTPQQSLVSQYVTVDSAIDPLIKLAEDLALLFFNLATSTSNASRYVALISFAKHRNSKLNLIGLLAVSFYNFFGVKADPKEPELQGAEEVVSKIRGLLDSTDDVANSPLLKKLKKFGLYVMSLEMFPMLGLSLDKCGYDAMEQAYIKRKYKINGSFLYLTLDLVTFIAEKGFQCAKLGRIDPFFHDTSSYQEWFNKAIELKRNSNFVSNPDVIPGFSIQRYLADLDETLEKSRVITKLVKKDSPDFRMLNTLIADLELCKINELSRRMAQKERKTPFAVLLAGGSSIGKSSLTQIIFQHYGKMFDLPCEPEFKYTRLATEKHWTNFASYSWCIQCDDIAYLKPNGELDPSLAEMLLMNNNVAYTPEQAALGDKGKTPVRAELIIATSNTEHLNLHAYFSCPYAVARRFPYIIVPQVKKEYAKDDKTLDPCKVPLARDTCYDDLWTFTIKKPVKSCELTAAPHKLEVIHEFQNLKEFLKWFSKEAREHEKTQRRVMDTFKTMNAVKICSCCDLPLEMCDNNLQSDSYTCVANLRQKLKESTKSFVDSLTLAGYVSIDNTRTWMCPLCEKKESHYCALRNDFKYEVDENGIKPVSYDPLERDRQILANLGFIDRYRLMFMFLWFFLAQFTIFNNIFTKMYGSNYKYSWYYRVIKDHTVARRIIVQSLAHRAENYINIPKCCKILMASVGTIVACVTLYKIFHADKKKDEPQGAVQSTGVKPQPDKEVIEKPFYYHDPYVINDLDVPKTVKACPRSSFIKRIEYNQAIFRMTADPPSDYHDRHYKTNNAINIGGCIWMVSAHSLPKGDIIYIDVIFDPVEMNVSRNIRNILVDVKTQVKIDNNDIMFIQIKNLPAMKQLSQFFTTPDFKFYGDGLLKGVRPTGQRFTYEELALAKSVIFSTHLDKTVEVYTGKLKIDETIKGDCGAVLVHRDMNLILGVHLILEKINGLTPISNIVYRKQIEDALAFFDSGKIQSGCIRINAPSSVQREIVPQHTKSPLRFLEQGTVLSVGALTGFRANNSSKLVDTHIKQSVLARGYKDSFGKPAMNWEPWYVALTDLSRPVTLLNSGIVDKVKTDFVNEIFARLPKDQLETVVIYDLDTVINGAEGVRFVDKMNRHTSAGYPYKKSKRHFLIKDEERVDKVIVHQEILDDAEFLLENYKQGILCHPVFNGNLKDEAKKIVDKKTGKCKMTRMFCGATFGASIVTRQYLLSVIKLIQENTFIFEAAVGIIAQSLEWEQMREHLAQFSLERVIAGDYAAFDKRMSSTMILAAFDIIIEICKRAGYSEEDLLVIRCIAYDTAFPTVDYNGDLIQFYGSNPSGHSLTVIINSLVNSLYMRYCFHVLGGDTSRFKENVCLMTYGDDNIMTVSNRCDFFNHTAIQKVLADCDIKYTMAEKDAVSVPFISLNDATFLKRKWRWDDDCGAYLAPLDSTSFDKMLTTRIKTDNISSEMHSIFVISSAIREYFFYGRQFFDEKRVMFQDIINETGLEHYMNESTLPTWDQLHEKFWLNSQHVKLRRDPVRPFGKYFRTCSVDRPISDDTQDELDCSTNI